MLYTGVGYNINVIISVVSVVALTKMLLFPTGDSIY